MERRGIIKWISLGQMIYYVDKNKNSFIAPHNKINSRWIKWLNVKTEATWKLEYKYTQSSVLV